MIIQEQIKKKVVSFGNGSIVYTPKTWIGKEVVITLPKLPIKEEIFKILDPYLEDIMGIYLYGSHARNEATSDSDVDILVISDKKFDIKLKNYDIIVATIEEVKESIKHNPIYSLLINEAKPILNSSLLREIKKTKFNKKDFKFILDTTKSILEINKEIINLEGNNLRNFSSTYSLMLRLRGLYAIDCIINNKTFTNKGFKTYFSKKINFNKLYNIYKLVRNKEKVNYTLSKKELIDLYNTVENETEKKSKKIN